jgi:hypothetical protein
MLAAAAAASSFVLLLQEVRALQALEGTVLSSSQVDALLLDACQCIAHYCCWMPCKHCADNASCLNVLLLFLLQEVCALQALEGC